MKHFVAVTCLLLAPAVQDAAVAAAADSVIVQSLEVAAGATETSIRIRIVNSSRLRSIFVPLEIRSVTPGSFITQLEMSYGDRLSGSLKDLLITNQYADRTGICKPDSQPGYGTPRHIRKDSTFSVQSSPWGVFFAAATFSLGGELAAGADSLGSLVLTIAATDTVGSFEIDTICTTPANHLLFVSSSLDAIYPSFQRGVITIDACNCSYHADLDGSGAIDGVDLSTLIDWVYSSIGPPPTDPSCPHVDRGDVDCSGADDAVDVSLMIDVVFFGSTACDPCACNPYPTGCP